MSPEPTRIGFDQQTTPNELATLAERLPNHRLHSHNGQSQNKIASKDQPDRHVCMLGIMLEKFSVCTPLSKIVVCANTTQAVQGQEGYCIAGSETSGV